VCVFPKSRPGSPTSYVVVFFVFRQLRWEVIVRFVDIGEIVDHHSLNFLSITDNTWMKQKSDACSSKHYVYCTSKIKSTTSDTIVFRFDIKMSTLIVEQETLPLSNRIDGIMVRELVSIAVGSRCEFISGQTKDYTIGMCCFSAKHAALRSKNK
jgi:hypothetical protein